MARALDPAPQLDAVGVASRVIVGDSKLDGVALRVEVEAFGAKGGFARLAADLAGHVFGGRDNAILFSFVLTSEWIPDEVTNLLVGLDLPKWGFLLVINLFLLVVGCFMETSSAILILAPILFPVATALGINPIHLGIIMVMNLEIGMVTPPFDLTLFVASGISGMTVIQVAKAALPSALVLLAALFLVTYVPEIALTLVEMGKSK